MSNVTGVVRARISEGANPTIQNVSLADAGTEYEITIPQNTLRFVLRSRAGATLRVAFVSGGTSVEWLTVPRGCNFSDDGLMFSGKIYVQSSASGDVAEVLCWT